MLGGRDVGSSAESAIGGEGRWHVTDTMKAAVARRYGPPDVVQVREVAKPAPQEGEVLVRVHATTVSRTDCGELRPHPFFARLIYGLRRPRRTISGMDFAGEIESVGRGVKTFKPGDRVFGMCPYRNNGAHAEYVSIPESGPITFMPEHTRFDEAVVCEGAFYANSGLELFHVGRGHTILVYGASGAIGTAAVQLAKAYGARVTAVVATRHLELARSLGADEVIDYLAGDFTRVGERFDFVLDAVGKASFFRCRRLLKPDGRFMSTDAGPGLENLPLALWSWVTRSNKVTVPLPPRGSGRRFVESLRLLLSAGTFRAVIDRRYPLDAIADAYRYVETGQKTGIVVINVVSTP
jgi:NADPH:quinone reductase-like Zn-dependent oxidoreductase